MVELLILVYSAIAFCVFRFLKVPLNKWTGTTTVVGGAVMIFLILLTMNFNHPFTSQGRFFFVTTPIVPAVQGLVTEVPVQANVPLKAGEVLFRIDARPFQAAVEQKRAALAEAEQLVPQLRADVDRARAQLAEQLANRDRAAQAFERYDAANESARRAGRPAVYSELDTENRRQTFLAAEAAAMSARAALDRAELALGSQIGGVNTNVARIRAELANAEWELDQTTVRAPTDGRVAQLILRPGMMAVPIPLRPVMVFVPSESVRFIGAFQQNALQRVRAGHEAEVAFKGIPGRVIRGRVSQVLDEMAVGQVSASGQLIDPAERPNPGRVLAEIEMLEDLGPYDLPGGATGEVAVYTEHWHHFAIIRRILLRMKAWENFIFLELH